MRWRDEMRSRREHLDQRVVGMRVLSDLDFRENWRAVGASEKNVQDEGAFGVCAVIEKLCGARSHDVQFSVDVPELEVLVIFDTAPLRIRQALRNVNGSRDRLTWLPVNRGAAVPSWNDSSILE